MTICNEEQQIGSEILKCELETGHREVHRAEWKHQNQYSTVFIQWQIKPCREFILIGNKNALICTKIERYHTNHQARDSYGQLLSWTK